MTTKNAKRMTIVESEDIGELTDSVNDLLCKRGHYSLHGNIFQYQSKKNKTMFCQALQFEGPLDVWDDGPDADQDVYDHEYWLKPLAPDVSKEREERCNFFFQTLEDDPMHPLPFNFGPELSKYHVEAGNYDELKHTSKIMMA